MPALAAGLVVAASVPPWGFWVLAIPGTALLAWRLGGLGAETRALAGLLFGFGLFGPTLLWISEFHGVGYLALLVLEGSFFAGAAALTPPGRWGAPLALPGAVVLAEAARGVVPFGGLPMGGIALGQAGGPLAPSARLGGALLVAALTVALGAACVAVARGRWRPAAVTAAVALAAAGGGLVAPDGRGAGPSTVVRTAIVQGGGPRGFRAGESDEARVFAAHLDQSARLLVPVDLVVWPENTVDVPAIEGSPEDAALGALATTLGATVVAGVTEDVGADRFANVAVAWAPGGAIVDRYTKAHRVPFGEYVPLRGLLEGLVDLQVLPRDAVAGTEPGLLRTPAGDLGVTISFEVFFTDRARAAVRAGGRLLLVPTNAASYSTSQVPTQEVAAARLRAWETGRWVVQAAPTGYGAFIDPSGRVVSRTVLGRPELLTGLPELRTGRTAYVQIGDGPPVVAAVVAVAAAWGLERRRPRVGARSLHRR